MPVWLGAVQRDPLAVGKWRNYKWKTSNKDIPSTSMVWANRYLPTDSNPEACGQLIPKWFDSRLQDESCHYHAWFICEW